MEEQNVIPYQPSDEIIPSGGAPAIFTTFSDPAESAAALLEAVSLADHVGVVFNLANIVAHKVTINGGEEGDIAAKRLVLVSDVGDAYACVSKGVYNALLIIFGLYGHPPQGGYVPPIPVKIVKVKAKIGSALTIVVQAASKKKARK